ncbi:MAG: hypothetical protein FJX77_14465, partial [Armatimonadetes bacterium]|nr:hypothetical protein [Armatimonadota bacterium]
MRNRALFLAAGGGRRQLVAVDSRTGVELWRRPLRAANLGPAPTECTGPTATPSGKVYVYDEAPAAPDTEQSSTTRGRGNSGPSTPGLMIRTFDVASGAEGASLNLREAGAAGLLPRLNLPPDRCRADPVSFYLFRLSEPLPDVAPLLGVPTRWAEWLGPPLVAGEQLVATGLGDLLLTWNPGTRPTLARLHRPMPGAYASFSGAAFFGAAPVEAGGNWILTDGRVQHKMVAALSPSLGVQWHRYFDFPVGGPTGSETRVFLPVGHPEGTDGILALDATSGQEIWLFRPTIRAAPLPALEEPRSPGGAGGSGGVATSRGKHVEQKWNRVRVRGGSVAQHLRNVMPNGPPGAMGALPSLPGSVAPLRTPTSAPYRGTLPPGSGSGPDGPIANPALRGARVEGTVNQNIHSIARDASRGRSAGRTGPFYPSRIPTQQELALLEIQMLEQRRETLALQTLSRAVRDADRNPGIVSAAGKVYGVVQGHIVALDDQSGAALWLRTLGQGVWVNSLAASREYLYLALSAPGPARVRELPGPTLGAGAPRGTGVHL